jgi:4'-phosphopantetheinyl transferase
MLRLAFATLAGKRIDEHTLSAQGCAGPPRRLPYGTTGALVFSISHTRRYTAVAFAADPVHPPLIGIDIEASRSVRFPADAAHFAFSMAEYTAVRAARRGERNRLFLTVWTRKEAVIKCLGGTVADDMDRFVVPVDLSGGPWDIIPPILGNRVRLRLADLDLGDGLFTTLCWKGTREAPRRIPITGENLEGFFAAFDDLH